jgi:predicted MFS family arabinose efflux permease
MIAVLSAGAAFGFATSVFYLLPKFLTEIGAGAAAIGATNTVYGCATVAITPLIALSIDAFPRVVWLRIGAILMLAGAAAFPGAETYGPTMLFLRALHGAAFGAFFTGLTALVTDVAPPRRFSEALGLAGASMLIMNAVAPAVVEPLAAAFGWNSGFYAAAVAAAVALAISCALPRVAPKGAGGQASGTLGSLLAHRRTQHYALVTAAVGAAFGVMFTYPQPYALELGMRSVRGFFVAYCTSALAARILLGRMSDRLGRFRVAVCALNLYTLVVLATAGLRPGMLEPLGALMGLAHGLFFPAFNAIVIEATAPHARGKMVTVFTAAFYGGSAAGTLPLGALAEAVGYAWVFVVSAAMTLAAGGLLVFSRELGGDAYGRGEVDVGVQLQAGAVVPHSGDRNEQTVGHSCAAET